MRHILNFFFVMLFASRILGQIVSLNPAISGPDDAITLTFDASQGNKELLGASKVYIHHGVVTDKPDGTAWKYVKGNWGKDDGIGAMTKVAGTTDKWQITFGPSLRSYFGVPAGENIFRISCVFRSADGSTKGTIAAGTYGWGQVTSNLDYYVNLKKDNFVAINQPQGSEGFLNTGEFLKIQGDASANATEMKIWVDEGNGYIEKAKVNTGKTISYNYLPTTSREIKIKVTAIVNGSNLEAIKNYNIIIRTPSVIAPLPAGMKSGANYDANDPTKVTLVLLAPQKEFVYAVGDFSEWKIKSENQMKKTPDGKYFWLEIGGLTPQKDYVYQYWIDGKLKIADPHTRQVADPWNDKWIESSVFPNLPAYNREDFGIASVFKTSAPVYNWAASEANWKKPNINHLVIYELHIRDFIQSHSYKDLTDTLSYLKRLGVNAIELMPLNEFEGNDSWGYNPSFFFALDKYYGTKDALKKFIETAHQHGMAVILDIVLNHAFGQSPMVQMYFEGGKPAANNPWFNREYVGPFQWGYDFNHESQYTKDFIDEVNQYWLEEFHFDGFRFDFTKGFTNYAPGNNIDNFDQSRINILKRMADKIRTYNNDAYIILEHWGPANEEAQLANLGMKMWRNKSYDFVPATVGNITGSFAGSDATSHVTFYNSHDERRIAEHCLAEGRASGSYNVKDSIIMYERVKMAAAFLYLQPGPKMMWQFDELGYDIDINFNGRTGRKPYVWGNNSLKYYNSTLRQHIYKTYQGLLHIRNTLTPEALAAAQKNHVNTGSTRRLSFNTPQTDLVVIGNFDLTAKSVNPQFTQSGKWYDYFSGDSITVTNPTALISLKAGEWHVYTTKRLAEGQADVVAIFENPVTITPYPFKGSDQITIRFDATKATKGNTAGLVGADKVYMHSGVILSDAVNTSLTNIKGTLTDDGLGLMTKVSDNIWEIKITPNQYYNIAANKEIFQIGMWFRNEDNTRKGFGFRNSVVYFDVQSDQPIITVNPPAFTPDTEVTITFNAKIGNRELVGADKVYMHSGVILNNTTAPKGSDWKKVVGNWGADDGVGLMTKVAGQTDVWQIKFKPRAYYNLTGTEFPFWIGAVFRNSGGTAKGTIVPAAYPFGFVDAASQDYFIKNQQPVSTHENLLPDVNLYPNPADQAIIITGIEGSFSLDFYNIQGQKVLTLSEVQALQNIDISMLTSGLYYYHIQQGDHFKSGKLVVK
jgi:1,4-alpha-glucan branching enzyme